MAPRVPYTVFAILGLAPPPQPPLPPPTADAALVPIRPSSPFRPVVSWPTTSTAAPGADAHPSAPPTDAAPGDTSSQRLSPLDDDGDHDTDEQPADAAADELGASLSAEEAPDASQRPDETACQYYTRVSAQLCCAVWETKRARGGEGGEPSRYNDGASSSRERSLGTAGSGLPWTQRLWRDGELSEREKAAVAHRVLCALQRVEYHYVSPGRTVTGRLESLNAELKRLRAPAAGTSQFVFNYSVVNAQYFPPDFIAYWCTQQMVGYAGELKHSVPYRHLREQLSALLERIDPERRAFPQGFLWQPPTRKKAWAEPLAVLQYMASLCRTHLAEADETLDYALEQCGKLPAGLLPTSGLSAQQIHGLLNWLILSSPPFQRVYPDIARAHVDRFQLQAVTYDGAAPLMVEAGPGAGKTRTIGRRALMLACRAFQPDAPRVDMTVEDIVAVTFTKRAAGNMADVLAGLGPRCTVCTMDSYLIQLLLDLRRRAQLPGRLRFLVTLTKDVPAITAAFPMEQLGSQDDTLQSKLAALLHARCPTARGADDAAVKATADAMAHSILGAFTRESRMRRHLLHNVPTRDVCDAVNAALNADITDAEKATKEKPLRHARTYFSGVAVNDALCDLCAWARVNHCYSFELDKELLLLAVLAPSSPCGCAYDVPPWTRSASIAAAFSEWKADHPAAYFIIDEFQDTNPAQLAVFTALAGPRLTVVGDSDQAIYGFRGAKYTDVEAQFMALTPQPTRVLLKVNYRSTSHIVAVSAAVVASNYPPGVGPKALVADYVVPAGVDLRVRLVHAPASKPAVAAHCDCIVAQTLKWRAAGLNLHDVAVLCASNDQCAAFLKELEERGLADCRALKGAVDDEYEDGKVKVGTVHDAKGMEWPLVFLYAFDTAQFNATRSPDAAAEQRRILYVGCSRAARLLHIHARSGNDVDSFLSAVAGLGDAHVRHLAVQDACEQAADAAVIIG